MLAIVLTFDSFPCAALGCYGNEWIDTPHFDRLAAEGFVCDAHVARSVEGSVRLDEPSDWWTVLADADVRCTQFREVNSQFRWDRAAWSDVRKVAGRCGSDVPPREWPFAKLMQAAREFLLSPLTHSDGGEGQVEGTSAPPIDSPLTLALSPDDGGEGTGRQLLWLHSAGIPLPCEVPPDVEALYVDEFADRGIDWSSLSEDERRRHPAVQAAYASCVDHFLGEFLDALAPRAASTPVLFVIGALYGGHWRDIPRRCALKPMKEAQWLRAPAIWWTGPSSSGRKILPGRSPAIVQPMDLGPTLLEWFEPSRTIAGPGHSLWPLFDGTAPRVREAAFLDGGVVWTEGDVTVLTDPASIDMATIQRFLWPEDPWAVNDVASQTPELVAERVALWNTSVPVTSE